MSKTVLHSGNKMRMSAGVTPSKYSLLLETECVVRTTLFPTSFYLHTLLQRYANILRCTNIWAYISAPTYTNIHTHAPFTPACTDIYIHCFLSFLSLWTYLQTSDLRWTLSGTVGILNILSSFLEHWMSEACIFIHVLSKFEPLLILKIREIQFSPDGQSQSKVCTF